MMTPISRPISAAIAGIATSLLLTSAHAQSTDADFAALAKAGKRADMEALARERLAKSGKDDVALWYLSRMVGNDERKREATIKLAEQCVAERPQSPRCHSALGSLYGSMAMSGGMTAGMKYVGKIKDAMLKAVELDPNNFDMRRDLIQFYLQAPGIAGGSVRRAKENADAFQKIDVARGSILRADVHVYEKEFDQAEAVIGRIKTDANSELEDAVQNATGSLGMAMVNANEAARAQKLFERLVSTKPTSAFAHFGLGRAMLEQKNFDAAIASIEKALQLEPKMTAHYRLGMAHQAKGNKARAISAYEQFLTYQTQGRAAEDARKRLDELKRG